MSPLPVVDPRYEPVRELGRGAMGIVFQARDLQLHRDVAVKMILGQRELSTERFRREGEVAARLAHPGIVRVFDNGVSPQGRPYLVTEFVPRARSLEEAFQGAPLLERVRLVRDVAEALGYAHGKGVVHRDVKPANVLVDAGGTVRVADFGLARAGVHDRLTRTGAMVGTPAYMAPEQIRGKVSEDPQPTLDVWALGVILYEAVSGAHPYHGGTILDLLACLRQPARPLRAVNPAVSAELEAVCTRALALEPGDRYRSAAEMAQDLSQLLRSGGVEGSRRIAPLAVGGLLGLLALVGVLLWPQTAREEAAAWPEAPTADRPPAKPSAAGEEPARPNPASAAQEGKAGPTLQGSEQGAPTITAEGARSELLRGIARVPQPDEALPGPVAVFGDDAFAVLTGRTRAGTPVAVMGATQHGKGRVLVFGHTSFFHPYGWKDDGWPFALNAVRWLAQREELDGVRYGLFVDDPRYTEMARRLRDELGVLSAVVSPSALDPKDVPFVLWYANRLNDRKLTRKDAQHIADYVAAGGGLWIGSCPWGSQQTWKIDLREDYPQNWVLGPMGMLLDPDDFAQPTDRGAYSTRHSRPLAVHGGRALAQLLGWEGRPYEGIEPQDAERVALRLLRALPRWDRLLVPRLLEDLEVAEGRFREEIEEQASRWR